MEPSKLGIYLHFPYCIQRCKYCHFVTLPYSSENDSDSYIDFLRQEIRARASEYSDRELVSVFFGGGTPSLMTPENIQSIISELIDAGIPVNSKTEVTLEVNPETMTADRFTEFIKAGVNRWSLGVQTLNPNLLSSLGREHSVDQSLRILQLFHDHKANFNCDLIFGLPHQTMADLKFDLNSLARFSPPHVSAYFLSLPEKHSLNVGRPKDEVQVEMFYTIEKLLGSLGLERYEISNFARPDKKCAHNQIYWADHSYWGLGLAAHSYEPHPGYGARFWNPANLKTYFQQVTDLVDSPQKPYWENLPKNQVERLKVHESLTDFCYTHLRTSEGLDESKLQAKFPTNYVAEVFSQLDLMQSKGLVARKNQNWSISNAFLPQSDEVFRELTFLENSV